jgi:Carboxypeptidase regulatory-like domain
MRVVIPLAVWLGMTFSCTAAEPSIMGTVVNRITGAPAPHARVTLLPGGAEVYSDAAGKFQFPNLDAGEYAVTAKKIGFEDGATDVELADSPTTVVIRLTPLASIRGRITDEAGDPVEGVTVAAFMSQVEDGLPVWTLTRQATSNDRGQYSIPLLPAGQYLVEAAGRDDHKVVGEAEKDRNSHEAFAPVYFGGAHERSAATVLTLEAGQETRADVSLALREGHTIRGTITNLKPYTQPTIQLFSGDDALGINSHSMQIMTGYFEIHNVLDGAYHLRIIGVGTDSQHLVGEQEIQVSGNDLEDLKITLDPGVLVNGSLRIEGNIPESAREMVSTFQTRFATPENMRSVTGAFFASGEPLNGAFETPRLIPGRYRISFRVFAPFYVSSARSGPTDLLASPELAIASGVPDVDVVLRADSGAVDLSIPRDLLDPDDACVLLVSESMNRPPEFGCPGLGDELEHVAPGSYRVHVWRASDVEESLPYQSPLVLRLLATGGTRVEVRPQARTPVRIASLSEVPK